jgi:hypothetical protein
MNDKPKTGTWNDPEVLEGAIVDDSSAGGDVAVLAPGTAVRVYRTSQSSPHWFYDPATGQCADPDVYGKACFSMDPYVDGTVREVGESGEHYQVTVDRDGRELYLDWMARYWVRLLSEEPPTYAFDAPRWPDR